MEWKMFGIKRKLGSAKQRVFKLFRLIGNSGDQDSNVSSFNQETTDLPYTPINFFTNYALEVELKKAEALEYWRRCLDRPK